MSVHGGIPNSITIERLKGKGMTKCDYCQSVKHKCVYEVKIFSS